MRILSVLIGLGMAGSGAVYPQFAIGPFDITTPTGRHELRRSPDCIVLRDEKQHERAILSLMHTDSDDSLDAFERICLHRIEAERSELHDDGFITPASPHPSRDGDTLFFSYTGGDKSSHRVFSTYMTMAGNDVFILYLEGIDVAPEDHQAIFEQLVANLRHR